MSFSRHMRSEHSIDDYVFLTIQAFDVPCRIMLPFTLVCPIEECGQPFAQPEDHNFGAHIRATHTRASVGLTGEMEKGKYFWWSIEPVDGQVLLSPALTNGDLFDAAKSLLVLPDSQLDSLDPALKEVEILNGHIERLDLDSPEDNLKALLGDMAIQEDAVEDVVMRDGPPEQDNPPNSFEVVPNLSLPPSLSLYGFGLLTLVGFPGQPTVIVCIKCRKVIASTEAKRCTEHYRLHEKSQEVEEEEEEGPEDVDSDVSEEPVQVIKRGRFQALTKWFETNIIPLSKIQAKCPPTIIPFIPFFPLIDGYRCPFARCISVAREEGKMKSHIQKEHMRVDEGDEGSRPIKCKLQTLNTHEGHTPFFGVSTTEEAAPVLSIHERAMQDLLSTTDLQTNPEGIEYTNALMDRFKYRSIYPPEFASYTSHVAQYIVKSTLIHTADQSPKEQLLAIGCFLYVLRVVDQLDKTADTYKRLLASKQNSTAINEANIASSFRGHSRIQSTITYSALYTSFLVYVLRCDENEELDSNLHFHNDHRAAAGRLRRELDAVCVEDLVHALGKIRRYPLETAYGCKPHIKDALYTPRVVEAAAGLFDLIHELAHSLVIEPKSIPANVPELRLPILRFFAWKAWCPYTKAFRTPNALHGLFCQVQWMMRLVVFEQFRRLTMEEVEDAYTILSGLHDRYLVQEGTSPFALLQNHVRFSSIIASSIAHAPTTTWQSEDTAISINGRSVSLEAFKDMVHNVIGEAKATFDEHVLFGRREEICGLEVGYVQREGGIDDQAYSTTNGYSYFKANTCFTSCRNKLGRFIVSDPEIFARFHQRYALEGGELAWNHAEIKRWLDAVDLFLRYLAAGVYWASGQPCRLPELISIIIENIPERPRHVYAIQNLLMIVQSYSKTLHTTQRPKVNIRMPAHELQELMEAFISLVHPLMVRFHQILGVSSVSSAHMFTQRGKPMREVELSKMIRQLSLKHVSQEWGVKTWRQYMISISQMCMPSDVLNLPLATTAITAQASHQQATVDLNYDQREDLSVAYISTQQFQQFRMVSLAWLELIGLPHPHRSCREELRLLVPPSAASNLLTTSAIEDMSLRVIQRVLQQERTSVKSIVKQTVVEAVVEQRVNNIITTSTVPLRITVPQSTLRLLQKIHPEGFFRSSQQAQSVQHVLERIGTSLLAVLPMGHGKSLIYQLPVLAERQQGQVTIVLVPLLSLAQAACDSSKKIGIQAHFINPKDPKVEDDIRALQAELVYCSYDFFLTSRPFQDWMATKINSSRMSRIVVDEAHTIVTERRFRTKFDDLALGLKNFSVPFVLMTGTLPFSIETRLLRVFSNCGIVSSVRLPTDISNLSYQVAEVQEDEVITQVLALFQERVMTSLRENPTQRAILYTQTTADARKLADALQSAIYMNPMDLEPKQKYLQEWLNPANQDISKHVMVATSSFALGVDYPDCPNVWFCGDPYGGIVNFAQMAARAGRNGQPANVVLFPSPTKGKSNGEDWELEAERDWEEFKITLGCRRTPLSTHLDGAFVTCACLPKSNPCDNCMREKGIVPFARSLSLNPVVTRVVEGVLKSRVTEVSDALYAFIETVPYNCVYCRFQNAPANHKAEDCESGSHRTREVVKAELREIRRKNRIENFVACLRCHLPQHKHIPNAMEHHLPYHGGPDDDCDLEGTVVDVLIAIKSSKPVYSALCHRSRGDLLLWLLTPITIPPCDPASPSRQLLRLHFIIPSIASISGAPPLAVETLCKEDWFQDWLVQPMEEEAPLMEVMEDLEYQNRIEWSIQQAV